MMALINNWDLKDSNNVILKVRGDNGNELRYTISDLGATFGHASTTPLFWRITRSRNNPANYAKSNFFEKVKGDRVVLHFGGKNRGLMKDIAFRTRSGSAVCFLNSATSNFAMRFVPRTTRRVRSICWRAKCASARMNSLSLRPNVQIQKRN